MATIDSVKLPDNSTYDVTDNYSGYAKKVAGATTDDLASLTATGDLADSGKKLSDLVLKSDVKDVLNSTSTTDPLSANQGRVLNDNIEAIVDVYGAKNLFDFDNYLNWIKSQYPSDFTWSKNNGEYAINDISYLWAAGAYTFSDVDIDIALTIQTKSNSLSSTVFVPVLYNSNNEQVVEELISINNSTFTNGVLTGHGSKIRFGYSAADGMTFKNPMIRDSRIVDDTFVPYVPTNRELMSYKANGKVGAKNLNSLPYYESVKSENGITFTSDDNGIVTASGTASALVALYMHSDTIPTNKLVLPKGDYTLSGCPVGGSQDTYCLRANFGGTLYYDIGSGVNFTLASDTQIEIAIIIKSGTALPVGGITFKPMIRIAEDTDPTFVPFAKTNKQLTTELKSLAFNSPLRKGLTPNSSVSYTVPNGVYLVTSWQGGSTDAFSGLWIAFVTPYASGCSVVPLVTPASNNITVSVTADTITVSHSGAEYAIQTNITCITEELIVY